MTAFTRHSRRRPGRDDLRKQFGAIIVVGVVTLVVMTTVAVTLSYRLSSRWETTTRYTAAKKSAMIDLVAAVGYGGVIHDFKKFVLRGHARYSEAANRGLSEARQIVERYRAVPVICEEETVALDDIEAFLDEYAAALTRARVQGDDAASRDAFARVDDSVFEAAFNRLREIVRRDYLAARAAFGDELRTAVIAWVGVGSVGIVVMVGVGHRVLSRGTHEVAEAIDDLAHAEALLQETGRVAKIGGWMVDLETMTPVWTDEVRRIHEVPDDYQPNLENAISFYAPEARGMVQSLVERGIATGEAWNIEAPLDTAKGRRIWVRALGKPEMVDGKCVKLWGAFQDITEVVEARREFEALQARFERAIAGTSDGLWEYTPATGDMWLADQFKRLVGIPEDELESFDACFRSFESVLNPLDRRRVISAIHAHVEQGAAFDESFRLAVRERGYRWFRARATSERDERGRSIRMSGAITDVHDERTAQNRLELAARAASVGLWDWDVPSGEVYFNDTYETMLGYEPGELAGCVETWIDLVHPDDGPKAHGRVRACLEGEETFYVSEFRFRRKDGEWMWIRAAGEVVEREPDGSPKRMIGVHVDIQALRKAIEASEQASRAKSEFLAHMSHEIRTPLTAILGFTDLLCDNAFDDREGELDAVRTIQINATHLLSVINDILDVSKIEAGQMSIERIETDPAAIVEELATLVRPKAELRGIELQVRYASPIPRTIETDPTRLRQILLNLVGNAIKFTERGSVTIRVSAAADTGEMRFAIEDTGIGMPPERLDVIRRFEPFQQGDASMSRKFGGTGLGLRISHALSVLLAGRLEVDSTRGDGCVFTSIIGGGDFSEAEMYVPGGSDEDTSSLPLPGRTAATGSDGRALDGVHVLLAEDGIDNQRLIAFHLKRAGADVTLCNNGREAVDAMEQAGPDDQPSLILMDMQMPELDGYEATKLLRDRGCDTPIIAITAHAMEGDQERCIEAGCDAYQSKPIDAATLIKVCARYAA